MKSKSKNKKVQLVVNDEAVATQLSTDSSYNWIIVEGLNKFNEGKIGKNTEYFLTTMGILEPAK